MIGSMTGIGQHRIQENGFDIGVTIKSINHRFLQVNIRIPRGLHVHEPVIRKKISNAVHRGKIDVFIEINALPENISSLSVNNSLIQQLFKIGQSISNEFDIPHGFTSERLLRFPDVIGQSGDLPLESAIEPSLMSSITKAISDLVEDRCREGNHLALEMVEITKSLQINLADVKTFAETQAEQARIRIVKAIDRLPGANSIDIDDSRLEQEIVLQAVRSDITEEITRLESHLARLLAILDKGGVIGKKTEFLIQECHREVNTIASKSILQEITSISIDMKTAVENLREQVQNLE